MVEPNSKTTILLKERASKLGFDTCRITPADLPEITGKRLETFVSNDRHGTMTWMETSLPRRRAPTYMWPEAKSAIMLGMNYGPDDDPMGSLDDPEVGTISVYARHRDYHDVIKGKLKELAGWVATQTGSDVKVFVDTAPLMEKPLAEQSGIGWQGKHTNLVSREFGSWLFIGAILTEAELEFDTSEPDHCGSCRACLDICPTDAFPAPYQLDARRCISYLTIEHAEPIPFEFRKAMGNRIYGCDDCLAVCPWNKYAKVATETKLTARDDLKNPPLQELVNLDDAAFRKLFSGSPIKRIGRNRFVRNVLIAMGNSNNRDFCKGVMSCLDEDDPVVRGAAVWAFRELEGPEAMAEVRKKHLEKEEDAGVREEWTRNG